MTPPPVKYVQYLPGRHVCVVWWGGAYAKRYKYIIQQYNIISGN